MRHKQMEPITEPRPLIDLRVEMVKKQLSLRDVANLSGVPYVSVSAILSGRLIQPANLEKIRRAVANVHSPEHQPA